MKLKFTIKASLIPSYEFPNGYRDKVRSGGGREAPRGCDGTKISSRRARDGVREGNGVR